MSKVGYRNSTIALACIALVSSLALSQDNGGKIEQQSSDARRVDDMSMEDLNRRLAEFEAGKRDARDGYIILNQLWINYQAQRKTSDPAFKMVEEKRERLVQENPSFRNLQDFRLSEKVRHDKKEQDEAERQRTKALERARNWRPADSVVVRILASGDRAVVRYQYKLVFYKLPSQVAIATDSNGRLKAQRAGQDFALSSLPPSKMMTFRRKISVEPNQSGDVTDRLLVCTDMVTGYTPRSDDEIEIVRTIAEDKRLKGRLLVNEAGDVEHFCGIVALDGTVTYKFPITQRVPDRLAFPIGISADGKRAAIALGERVRNGDIFAVGKFREALVWEFPDKLKKVPLENPQKSHLREKFRRGEF